MFQYQQGVPERGFSPTMNVVHRIIPHQIFFCNNCCTILQNFLQKNHTHTHNFSCFFGSATHLQCYKLQTVNGLNALLRCNAVWWSESMPFNQKPGSIYSLVYARCAFIFRGYPGFIVPKIKMLGNRLLVIYAMIVIKARIKNTVRVTTDWFIPWPCLYHQRWC